MRNIDFENVGFVADLPKNGFMVNGIRGYVRMGRAMLELRQ